MPCLSVGVNPCLHQMDQVLEQCQVSMHRSFVQLAYGHHLFKKFVDLSQTSKDFLVVVDGVVYDFTDHAKVARAGVTYDPGN